jgi:hypothetical protein
MNFPIRPEPAVTATPALKRFEWIGRDARPNGVLQPGVRRQKAFVIIMFREGFAGDRLAGRASGGPPPNEDRIARHETEELLRLGTPIEMLPRCRSS